MRTRRHRGAPLGHDGAVHAWHRPAAFDPHVVHLSLSDDSVVPAPDEVDAWVAAITADPTVTRIRTSALFPAAASRFRDAGFVVADELALLRASLDDPVVTAAIAERHPSRRLRTVSLRTGELTAAAKIDQAAFGARWGHDAGELEQIRFATPFAQMRARVEPAGMLRREVLAVAISGSSNEHGYLQRLSVRPDQQRRGHGRALTVDALAWMRRRGLRDCLVNTSVDNQGALALYRSVGFTPMADHLEVLELDVVAR